MTLEYLVPLGAWPPGFLVTGLAVVSAIALAGLLYARFFYVDISAIRGIPKIPASDLFAGHLYRLGRDHSTTAENWAKTYGWPVFQIRMGQRRAIVLNSFESTREWIVKNQSATLDRPWFYTFHGVVSATSAATIGTSPWNDRTKKQRRIVGSLTTSPSIQQLAAVLDLESAAMIATLFHDSHRGRDEIMPHIYEKRVSLNLMTMFCYGTRFTRVDDPMFLQILSDATTIASFRSTQSNPQDFIPYLRYMPRSKRTATAVEVRGRRDTWLAAMLDRARQRVMAPIGSHKTVAELLLTDSTEGLTTLDIRTILGGLMSGGFETIFTTTIITTGMLGTRAGQTIQQRAYDDIMTHYDTPETAFAQCVSEEKSVYVAALVKEALRFYPPLKLLPARQTFKEFVYQGSVIPKGLLVYINAQAANRDESVYGADAAQFNPERWIPGSPTYMAIPPPYHFAYGAGARMCTAVNFSNRMLYALFVRLILAFHIDESTSMPANTDYVAYKQDPAASNAIPSAFKVRLTPRDTAILENCLAQSQSNTAHLATGDRSEALVQ